MTSIDQDRGRGGPSSGPADVGGGASVGFGDRVAQAVRARQSQLVLGLDPDPQRLWPRALEFERESADPQAPPAWRAAQAVAIHCALAIEAVAEHCVAVKLQLACFERLGPAGLSALAEVADHARRHGLLVIADAKRGDIDVSAAAYAQAFLGQTPTPYGPVPGLGADALTVSPLLGADSLAPLLAGARESGAGLFVLVRTSNRGAADIQGLVLEGGGTVTDRLAALVAELGARAIGASGLADVGAVVGATAPEHLARLREAMPSAIFLLPGVGAQGGRVEDLAAAFAPGPAGGLVTASRGLTEAHAGTGQAPEVAAAREAARLRELAWDLAAG